MNELLILKAKCGEWFNSHTPPQYTESNEVLRVNDPIKVITSGIWVNLKGGERHNVIPYGYLWDFSVHKNPISSFRQWCSSAEKELLWGTGAVSSHHWLTADSGPNAPELQPWGQEASDREETLLFKTQVGWKWRLSGWLHKGQPCSGNGTIFTDSRAGWLSEVPRVLIKITNKIPQSSFWIIYEVRQSITFLYTRSVCLSIHLSKASKIKCLYNLSWGKNRVSYRRLLWWNDQQLQTHLLKVLQWLSWREGPQSFVRLEPNGFRYKAVFVFLEGKIPPESTENENKARNHYHVFQG